MIMGENERAQISVFHFVRVGACNNDCRGGKRDVAKGEGESSKTKKISHITTGCLKIKVGSRTNLCCFCLLILILMQKVHSTALSLSLFASLFLHFIPPLATVLHRLFCLCFILVYKIEHIFTFFCVIDFEGHSFCFLFL